MIEIDIIILSNASNSELRETTDKAIQSLINAENPELINFKIYIIESNSKAKIYNYPNTFTLFPKGKFGFHKFLNFGIKKSSSPFVCLCNNDLIFHKNWATEIITEFNKSKDLVSASPACSLHHPKHGIPIKSGTYFGYEVRKEIAGWCLFFKRDILKVTGPLDEKFKFWYADNDYAKTLELHGLKHALVSDSIVDHLESKTLNSRKKSDQYLLTQGARFYFEYKWEDRSYFSYLNCLRKLYFKTFKINLKPQTKGGPFRKASLNYLNKRINNLLKF